MCVAMHLVLLGSWAVGWRAPTSEQTGPASIVFGSGSWWGGRGGGKGSLLHCKHDTDKLIVSAYCTHVYIYVHTYVCSRMNVGRRLCQLSTQQFCMQWREVKRPSILQTNCCWFWHVQYLLPMISVVLPLLQVQATHCMLRCTYVHTHTRVCRGCCCQRVEHVMYMYCMHHTHIQFAVRDGVIWFTLKTPFPYDSWM